MTGAAPGVCYRVALIGAGGERIEFSAEPRRSIAKAAACAGFDLTTGCLQGRCAICRGRVVEGTVAAVRRPSKNAQADPARRADGCVLLCAVGPQSDVVIEALSPWTVRATSPQGPG